MSIQMNSSRSTGELIGATGYFSIGLVDFYALKKLHDKSYIELKELFTSNKISKIECEKAISFSKKICLIGSIQGLYALALGVMSIYSYTQRT